MISKLITGNGFGGAVRYSTKYGKDPDGTLHKLLSVCGVTFEYDEKGNLIINPRKVAWDFRQQALGYNPDTKNYRPIQKPVYHWILSWKEGEREILPKEMCEVAKEFLRRIGFTNTQCVISAHYDQDNQHLHIVTNIVNNKGKRINTKGLINKAHEVAAAITKERGYAWGEPASKKTVESAKKSHEKVRYIIEPMIFKALKTSLTIDELVAELKKSNISTIVKHAENGKRGGISFAYTYNGEEHTFRGSSVDRKLSYGNIMEQMCENLSRIESAIPKEKILELYPAEKEVYSFVTETYDKYKMLRIDHQRRKDINEKITNLYDNLRTHYFDLRAQKLEERLDSENIKDLLAVGIILMGTFPLLGLALTLLSFIMEWVYKEENIEEKRRLIEKIDLAKKSIHDLKVMRAELGQNQEGSLVLNMHNAAIQSQETDAQSVDDLIADVDRKLRPYKKEIYLAEEKDALATMPLPDVILVTVDNYRSIRLPDGFEPYRLGNNIVIKQQVVPEDGLIIFKNKLGYGILPKGIYERYQNNLRNKAGKEMKSQSKKGIRRKGPY